MRILILIATLVFGMPRAIAQDDWYKDVAFVITDPLQFDVQRPVLFPASGLHLEGSPASGKLYAVLPSSTIDKLKVNPQHTLVIDSHTLNATEANSYKQIFHDDAAPSLVPWFVGAIADIPTPVSTSVGVTLTILDALSRYDDSTKKISPQALEQLMSTDGRFDLALMLTADPDNQQHQFVASAVVYTVKVGSETRTYVISSSTFALKTS